MAATHPPLHIPEDRTGPEPGVAAARAGRWPTATYRVALVNDLTPHPDPNRRGLDAGRIGLAWLTVVGVDLFFNAGVFVTVFEQAREPALLPDTALFRRIPVAYAALAVAVTALAWLLRLTGDQGVSAIKVGAGSGLVLGVAGLGALWTALDITGLFVIAGIVVAIVEGSAAAAVLASRKRGLSLRIRVAAGFVVLAGLGQIVANIIGR